MCEDKSKTESFELIVREKEVVNDDSLEREADHCAKELRKWADNNKILPLKQLADIGKLPHLKYILPISQYSSEFIRKLAKHTACRIILRELRKSTDNNSLPADEKKKYVDLLISLNPKYEYLNDFDLRDSKIQDVLFDILAQENKEFTAQRLGEILTESDKYTRATAVKIIAEILHNTQTNLLIKLLRDPDARVRANVIEALELVGNPNVVGILLRYKKDKDERVRANAIKALWNLGYKEVESSLTDMIYDQKTSMQISGIWVIGEIGHNQPDLKNLLRIVDYEEDPAIKLKVLQARRKIKLRERELRILVLDNDKGFLRNFFYQLAKDGFHIHAAFDGKSGVRSAEMNAPELILVNNNISDPDDIDIIGQLNDNEKTRDLPVIEVSDGPENQQEKNAEAEGIYGPLVKPFDYEDFIRIVMKIFDL